MSVIFLGREHIRRTRGLQWRATKVRISDISHRSSALQSPILRYWPTKIVIGQVNKNILRQVPQARRNDAGEPIVRQIQSSLKIRKITNITRNRTTESIVRKIKLFQSYKAATKAKGQRTGEVVMAQDKGLQSLALDQRARYRTGEQVAGKVQALEVQKLTDRWRDRTRQEIPKKDQPFEPSGGEEASRKPAEEPVAPKVDMPERLEGAKGRGEVAHQLLLWQA